MGFGLQLTFHITPGRTVLTLGEGPIIVQEGSPVLGNRIVARIAKYLRRNLQKFYYEMELRPTENIYLSDIFSIFSVL